MSFELSKDVNPPCVFLVGWSNLKGRLDVEYNRALLGTRIESVYPTSKLRDLVSSRTGGTPRKSESSFWEGDIPWASPKDFGSFFLVDTEDHISEAAVLDSATTLVPASSLLVVFRSGILQHSLPVAVTTRDTTINQDLKALLPIANASTEYLAAYFVIFGKRLLPLITKSGATVQSINTAQFNELEVAVPPRPIQDQIVSKLVEAFRHKLDIEAKAKTLLASIDDLLLAELGIPTPPELANTLKSRIFQRKFSELSGNRFDPTANQEKRKRLREAIHAANCPVVPLRKLIQMSKVMVKEINGGDIYVGLENISGDTGDFISTNDKDSVSTAVKFQQGQILFPKLRPYLNKTHLADFDGLCSTEFHVFTAQKISADYLTHFLRSQAIVGITSLLMTGNTLPRLQTEDILKLPIPQPSPEIQKKICSEITSIRSQARSLRAQAQADLEQAKRDIEAMILGKPNKAPAVCVTQEGVNQ